MRVHPIVRTFLRWGARLTTAVVALAAVTAGLAYGLSGHRLGTRFDVPPHPITVPNDPATIARGRHVATVRGCVDCHGAQFGGNVILDAPALGRLAGPNLTSGGRGAALSDADWERAVRHGVRRDGTSLLFMPAGEFNGIADEDLAAIVAYARSLPAERTSPPPSWVGPVMRGLHVAGQIELAAGRGIDHRRAHPARFAPEPTVAYGAYLAAGCTGCHGPGLAGGKIPGAPPEWKPASNITPAGIGHYSHADFVRALRTGRRPGGAPIDTLMPWRRVTSQMTDVELEALYRYLRTVPPKPFGTR